MESYGSRNNDKQKCITQIRHVGPHRALGRFRHKGGGQSESHSHHSHRNAVGLVCRALGCSLISWSSWVQVLKGHPVSVVSFLPAKQTKLSLRISSHVEPSLRAILDSIVTARGWATYNSTTECLAAYAAYLAGRGARSRPWTSIRLVAGDGVDFTSKTRRCAITAAKLVVTVSELCREMSVPGAERHLVV